MAVTVKNVTIWRKEVGHGPGLLARALQPLADAGANLQIIMAYAEGEKGIVEVGPISGKKVTDAATKTGFAAYDKPTLLVEGSDRPGLGAKIASAIAAEGISISFDITQVSGRRFFSIYGFESPEKAKAAVAAIKKAAR